MHHDLNQSLDIPLHDIKDIVEVNEPSLYYFLALVLFVTVLVVAVLYLLYRWYGRKKAFNKRKEHYKTIKKLDLKDTKKAAYTLTLLGLTFRDDSPRHTQMYENLTKRLQRYKYRKDVESFDKETLGYIKVFQEMIDA